MYTILFKDLGREICGEMGLTSFYKTFKEKLEERKDAQRTVFEQAKTLFAKAKFTEEEAADIVTKFQTTYEFLVEDRDILKSMGITAEHFIKPNTYPANFRLSLQDLQSNYEDYNLQFFFNEFVKPNKKIDSNFIPLEWISLFRNKLVISIDEFAMSMADLCWIKQKKANFDTVLSILKENAAEIGYCIQAGKDRDLIKKCIQIAVNITISKDGKHSQDDKETVKQVAGSMI